MLTSDKRQPAFDDNDKMLLGKYHGEYLVDIPASYLLWLYNEMKPQYQNTKLTTHSDLSILNKLKLFNYIHNSMDALKDELNES